MKIAAQAHDSGLRVSTRRLAQRMLSPLTGLDQTISFILRDRSGPRFIVAGAELTGVHLLSGHPRPRRLAGYHIGGCGIFPEEALIRCLGESLERYSQFVSEITLRHRIRLASYTEMLSDTAPIVPMENLRLFSTAQLQRPRFPFKAPSEDMPLGWVRAVTLPEGDDLWVPAQLTLVGYLAKAGAGEDRIGPAVTTGSAAHTSSAIALRNSLLELIQIDSAIGHWYSSSTAIPIRSDHRSAAIDALITSRFPPHGPQARFFWLPNPDLPGVIVACRLQERTGALPANSLGLGADLDTGHAMYKALLEAIGVRSLSKFNLLELAADPESEKWYPLHVDPSAISDLDTNVAYYALPENADVLDEKFPDGDGICAGELPEQRGLALNAELRLLVSAFRHTGKSLVLLDLTTADARALGFTALRVWSPDTLSLPLPSMPPLGHKRFAEYGRLANEQPHPYP